MTNPSIKALTLPLLLAMTLSGQTTRVEDSDPAITKTGAGWKTVADAGASGGSYLETETGGDSLQFRFTGDSVTIVRRVQNQGSHATITVDGVERGILRFDFAVTRLQAPALLEGFGPGEHTLIMTMLEDPPIVSQRGQTVSISFDAFETPVVFEPSAGQQAALNRYNQLRANFGLPAVRLSPALSRAAQSHADYMAQYNVTGAEEANNGVPEYTGQFNTNRRSFFGYLHRGTVLENLASLGDPVAAIDSWVAGAEERVRMFGSVGEVGYGVSLLAGRRADDMLFSDRGAVAPTEKVLATYPANGQTAVPVAFVGNISNQLGAAPPLGFPVSLHIRNAGARGQTPRREPAGTLTGPGNAVIAVKVLTDTNYNNVIRDKDTVVLVPLAPLTPGTLYSASITGVDSFSNPYEVTWTFTTAGNAGISDPRVIRATSSTATIQWSTAGAVAATSLEYGTTTGYGTTAPAAANNDPAKPNQWAVEITGLAPNTLYNYRISSTDGAGNRVATGNLTFTTPAPTQAKLSRGTFSFGGAAVALGQDNILAATGGDPVLLDMNDLNGGQLINGDLVTIQLAGGGAFITAGPNGALTVGPTTAGDAETFEITVNSGYRFRANNNLWVKVQGDRKLAATANDAGDSLLFLGGEVATPPPAPNPGSGPARLSPGGVLLPNNQLLSPNKAYRLLYQPDGNLVLYKVADNDVIWASGTQGRTPSRLVMQTDGNLVMYGIDNNAQWHAATFGNDNSTALLQDDGRFIIVNSIGQVIWENGTVPALQPPPERSRLIPGAAILPGQSLNSVNGTYQLSYQTDGNLVVYRVTDGAALWSSGTFGKAPGRVCMQVDGNLVMYGQDGAPQWATGTNAPANVNSELVMQTDGNLVIYNPNSAAIWSIR